MNGMKPILVFLGRTLTEAIGAAGSAVAASYQLNPNITSEQAAQVAATAAIGYVVGRLLPALRPS